MNNFIPLGGTSAAAFGINDKGQIVGQSTTRRRPRPGSSRPPPIRSSRSTPHRGPTPCNAQGINNHGLIVGFYVGTDGQDHGFMANLADVHERRPHRHRDR